MVVDLRLGIVRSMIPSRRDWFRNRIIQIRAAIAAGLYACKLLSTLPKIAVTGEVIPLAAFAKVDTFWLFHGSASPVGLLDGKVCDSRCRLSKLACCGALSLHRD